MLVIARYTGQEIHINNDLVIKVLHISEKTVRLGITGPVEKYAVLRAPEHEPLSITGESNETVSNHTD